MNLIKQIMSHSNKFTTFEDQTCVTNIKYMFEKVIMM